MLIDVNSNDVQERLRLLSERKLFHSLCSSQFLKSLNSGKLVGAEHDELRKVLAVAIDYHQGVFLKICLEISQIKKTIV